MEFRLQPLGFMEFFAKPQENEMNRKSEKYWPKPVGFRMKVYVWL